MKIKEVLKTIMKLIGLIILAVGCFSLAFFITKYIYNILDKTTSEVIVQVSTSMVGLIFIGIAFSNIRYFDKGQEQYMSEIYRTLKKISGGDFKVKIKGDFRHRRAANELVEGINDMTSNLNEMEKMKQEFISNVSHEIQSPLTSIRGFAQVLKNDKLSYENRLYYLSIIENESNRLSKLSDNLLKLTALESDYVNLNCKPYRLDKQIKNIVLLCEPQWSQKDIDMEVFVDDVIITADEDLLSQVWINLINNSIKFTPQNGNIKIYLHTRDNSIEFRISDTGVGIGSEDKVHVFDRFYKADKSRNRNKEGNGLGLSIVKKIIDMHKGNIDIESKLGEGTMFIVILQKKL